MPQTKTACLIACSNGLGHLKRLMLLSIELEKIKIKSTIYARTDDIEKICLSEEIAIQSEHIEFDTHTKILDQINGDSFQWLSRIGDLSNYDFVISDNLLEILEVRPDAWILGSFFWHKVLRGFPEDIANKLNNLLIENQPKNISSGLFTSKYLQFNTRLFEVGLFSSPNNSIMKNYKDRKDLLISCGKTGILDSQVRKFVSELAKLEQTPFDKVWVEPSLTPKNPPIWMKKAIFTPKMYQEISAAIIRPGIGTVSSCIINGVKIFTFYEENNTEMIFNSEIIQKNHFGQHTSSIKLAWDNAVRFFLNQKTEDYFPFQELNINGAKESAKIIAS